MSKIEEILVDEISEEEFQTFIDRCFNWIHSFQINSYIWRFELSKIGDEDFTVYDLNNHRKYKSRGPFKGKIIAPVSRHSKPDDERPDLITVQEYKEKTYEGKEQETD